MFSCKHSWSYLIEGRLASSSISLTGVASSLAVANKIILLIITKLSQNGKLGDACVRVMKGRL